MSEQPLLSVIVPVYNAGRFLPRCMESLLQQTYANLEIILVDDGSLDESPRLCDSYARDYDKVRVIHKENGGAGYARNSGLEIAEGEYIAFVDADDYIDKNMFSRLMAETQKAKMDAVFCDFVIQKDNGDIKYADSTISAGRYTGREILLHMLGAFPEAKNDFVFGVSVWKGVYSRNIIESSVIRFQSEREIVSEDLFFHIDFLPRAHQVCYIRERMYVYCDNDGSYSRSYVKDRLKKEEFLYQSVCRLAAGILQGDEMLRWQRFFLGRVRSTIGQYVYYVKDCSFRERIKEIRKIANNELVCSVIGSYPFNRNPLKLRIFNTFLKWKFCTGMYILLALNR